MNIYLNIYISNCSHLQVNKYLFIKMKKYLNIQLKKYSNKQLSIYKCINKHSNPPVHAWNDNAKIGINNYIGKYI